MMMTRKATIRGRRVIFDKRFTLLNFEREPLDDHVDTIVVYELVEIDVSENIDNAYRARRKADLRVWQFA